MNDTIERAPGVVNYDRLARPPVGIHVAHQVAQGNYLVVVGREPGD